MALACWTSHLQAIPLQPALALLFYPLAAGHVRKGDKAHWLLSKSRRRFVLISSLVQEEPVRSQVFLPSQTRNSRHMRY
jgi:hypothetical protein